MKAKHTPTPWVADGHNVFGGRSNKKEINGVAICSQGYAPDLTPHPLGVANASFIVTACNAHEALMSDLRWILDATGNKVHPQDTAKGWEGVAVDRLEMIAARVRSALAEGESND